MARNIKLIIFDLDGTLVNAYKAVARSINYALKKMGLNAIDDYTIQRSVGWGEKKLLISLMGADRAEEILKDYRDHHARALRRGTKFLPKAKQLIKHLKKSGYKLAIASNRPTKFTHIILRHLAVKDAFSYVLCGDRVKRPKPSGEMLRKILQRFTLRPKDALYVGDMTIDALAGRRARIKTVIVTTGSSTREEIAAHKPHKIIHEISHVKGILEELA